MFCFFFLRISNVLFDQVMKALSDSPSFWSYLHAIGRPLIWCCQGIYRSYPKQCHLVGFQTLLNAGTRPVGSYILPVADWVLCSMFETVSYASKTSKDLIKVHSIECFGLSSHSILSFPKISSTASCWGNSNSNVHNTFFIKKKEVWNKLQKMSLSPGPEQTQNSKETTS
jgi:hypothetical protein